MKKITFKSGFTLVEMLVSVSLFIVVALIVSGVFVTVAKANRQAQAIRVLADNMSFVLDTISYNLKLGGQYDCGESNSDGSCIKITFEDLEGENRSFGLSGNGQVVDEDLNPLTTENINITSLNFEIKDTGTRPLVQIYLLGEGLVNGKPIIFNLQTAVSQRNWVSIN